MFEKAKLFMRSAALCTLGSCASVEDQIDLGDSHVFRSSSSVKTGVQLNDPGLRIDASGSVSKEGSFFAAGRIQLEIDENDTTALFRGVAGLDLDLETENFSVSPIVAQRTDTEVGFSANLNLGGFEIWAQVTQPISSLGEEADPHLWAGLKYNNPESKLSAYVIYFTPQGLDRQTLDRLDVNNKVEFDFGYGNFHLQFIANDDLEDLSVFLLYKF